MAKKESVKVATPAWKFDELGYRLRRGLRKGTDSNWSSLMYNLVDIIEDEVWGDYVEALTERLRTLLPKGIPMQRDRAVGFAPVLGRVFEEESRGLQSNAEYRTLALGFRMCDARDLEALSYFLLNPF